MDEECIWGGDADLAFAEKLYCLSLPVLGAINCTKLVYPEMPLMGGRGISRNESDGGPKNHPH